MTLPFRWCDTVISQFCTAGQNVSGIRKPFSSEKMKICTFVFKVFCIPPPYFGNAGHPIDIHFVQAQSFTPPSVTF